MVTFDTAFQTEDSPQAITGTQRRQNLKFDFVGVGLDANGMVDDVDTTILPPDVYGISSSGTHVFNPVDEAYIWNIAVSADMPRRQIPELGTKTPFTLLLEMPVEVRTEIEIIAVSGDFVSTTEGGILSTGAVASSGSGAFSTAYSNAFDIGAVVYASNVCINKGNLPHRTIRVATCDGLRIYTGTKNKLSSVNYTGGDVDGGNVVLSYTFTTQNHLTIMHTGDPNQNFDSSLLGVRQTYLRETASLDYVPEGFGSVATGGEGKAVVWVTNLNDSGAGSLREALSSGSRIVKFTVGGTITLETVIDCTGDDVTIDGFSAPNPGITIKAEYPRTTKQLGALLEVSGDNYIIRGLRIRPGPGVAAALTVRGVNIMVDHCSFGWSIDQVLNAAPASPFTWGSCKDVTFQWCIIHEALELPADSQYAHASSAMSNPASSDNGGKVRFTVASTSAITADTLQVLVSGHGVAAYNGWHTITAVGATTIDTDTDFTSADAGSGTLTGYGVPHSDACLIGQGATNVTVHHCLFVHNQRRSPQITSVDTNRVRADVINNVIYDWYSPLGKVGWATYLGGLVDSNIQSNWYGYGPTPPGLVDQEIYLFKIDDSPGPEGSPAVYLNGNVGPYDPEGDSNTDMVRDAGNAGAPPVSYETEPFSGSNVNVHTASKARELILATAGASLWRDAVDARVVSNVINGTGNVINDPSDVGGWV